MMGGAPSEKLGIVAGGGALPGLLASACAASGRAHYILALTGFAEANQLPRSPDGWMRLGEIGRGFEALRQAGVGDVVLAGSVKRPALNDLKPDLKGASLLARIAGRTLGDDSLLSAVITEIEREGFNVVGVDSILTNLLAGSGPLGRNTPDKNAWGDIARGFEVARALGAADVGQAAVVQQGIVLGVEAVEGTDALLERCASLRREGPGGVLVKVKKPQQERRADLPTIGPATVKNAHAAGLRGIAVEMGHALIIDQTAVTALADELELFVVGHGEGRSEAGVD
jgi:UDP-2,3-diacylglucosamine hydrolase